MATNLCWVGIVKELIQYHPERLNKVITSYPDFFFKFSYNLVKPFLDKRTMDKISVFDVIFHFNFFLTILIFFFKLKSNE